MKGVLVPGQNTIGIWPSYSDFRLLLSNVIFQLFNLGTQLIGLAWGGGGGGGETPRRLLL
jgi:hypothetical protein